MIVRTRVNRLTRRNNSRNGNPAWTLHTDDGDFPTKPDISDAYGADNRENMAPNVVLLDIDGRGRVQTITPEED